jgi:hypothetical protein
MLIARRVELRRFDFCLLKLAGLLLVQNLFYRALQAAARLRLLIHSELTVEFSLPGVEKKTTFKCVAIQL